MVAVQPKKLRQHPRLAALFTVLIVFAGLRRRIIQKGISLSKGDKKSPHAASSMMATTPQIELAIRDLYSLRSDGTRQLSLVDSSGLPHKIVIKPTPKSVFEKHRPYFQAPSPDKQLHKVGVNANFLRQLNALIRIIIPSPFSKEAFMFILHTFFLVMRTYLSLVVAKLDGIIVRDLVSANAKGFATGLVYWFALAVPSTYTTSMIRYLQQKLAACFRTRLTRYVHDLYLSDQHNFYKLLNLDNRIESPDQFITTDIQQFCDTLSSLYSNVSKPLLDLILFNIQLSSRIGGPGAFGLFCNYMLTAYILRKVTPAFGKLAAVEAKLEGDFRAAHTRVITNAEEIAFYDGASIEKSTLDSAYNKLIKHINSIFKIRIAYGMTEDFVIKYAWSAAGYVLISIPVFFSKKTKTESSPEKERDQSKIASRTESYISNRRILLALADAGSRMMYSYKELAQLAGYTSRVYNLVSTLHELDSANYVSVPRPESLPESEPFYDLGNIKGSLTQGHDYIKLDNVPIVAPAAGLERGGEKLVSNLSFQVNPGDHLLVTGPNGVGKTGLVRIVAGLWPAFEGLVERPELRDIVFLPQRPYLSIGSLRDQIIYPHSYSQMIQAGYTDVDLLRLLGYVHLDYLPDREGGFDTRKEWKDVLSGGEKQRMGLARLFYHKPRFALLDECTSAVSTDVEGLMYQQAKDMGITLITISHRPSLFKYHNHLLRLSGDENGSWEMNSIGAEREKLSMEKEIEELENKLQHVDQWKSRLTQIEEQLAFTRS